MSSLRKSTISSCRYLYFCSTISTLNYEHQGNFMTHNHLCLAGWTMNSFLVLGWTISSARKHASLEISLVVTFTIDIRFAAVEALSESASSNHFPLEGNVNCIALFNHEEIGSVSTTGAQSSLLPSLLQRLSPTPALLAQSIAKSLLLSADMGHAIHPNYTSKHEDNHRPRVNGGIVIKTNAKQKYASDAIGSFILKRLLEKRGGKAQEYEVRNDMYVDQPLCLFISDMERSYIKGLWVNCWPHAV
jgi:Aminopeptidase I zinc metalloprotease (M18)